MKKIIELFLKKLFFTAENTAKTYTTDIFILWENLRFCDILERLGFLVLSLLQREMREKSLWFEEIQYCFFQLVICKIYLNFVVQLFFKGIPILLKIIEYFYSPGVLHAFRALVSLIDL